MAVELEILADRVECAVDPESLRGAVLATLRAAGVDDGHLAVALVPAAQIRELNLRHRGQDRPTDVLSFPVDPVGGPGPRELGDVVICPEHTEDLLRATVHGVLHLLGHDHEVDDGRMLMLEDATVGSLR